MFRRIRVFNDKDELLSEITLTHNNYYEVMNTDLGKSLVYRLLVPKEGLTDYKFLIKWLSARLIPPTRYNIREILDELGLKEYDVLGLAKATSARNISDDIHVCIE